MSDPVQDEIDQLRAEIKTRTDRIAELRKLRGYPRVIPTLVYWRYHKEIREEYDDWDYDEEWDLVEQAYHYLMMQSDNDQIGSYEVELAGVRISGDRYCESHRKIQREMWGIDD